MPQWFISDLPIIFSGATHCGVYTTSCTKRCHDITEHNEASIVAVENAAQLTKFAIL